MNVWTVLVAVWLDIMDGFESPSAPSLCYESFCTSKFESLSELCGIVQGWGHAKNLLWETSSSNQPALQVPPSDAPSTSNQQPPPNHDNLGEVMRGFATELGRLNDRFDTFQESVTLAIERRDAQYEKLRDLAMKLHNGLSEEKKKSWKTKSGSKEQQELYLSSRNAGSALTDAGSMRNSSSSKIGTSLALVANRTVAAAKLERAWRWQRLRRRWQRSGIECDARP